MCVFFTLGPSELVTTLTDVLKETFFACLLLLYCYLSVFNLSRKQIRFSLHFPINLRSKKSDNFSWTIKGM